SKIYGSTADLRFCAVFVEATGWGLPVCRACCTPKEAQGCIRHGIIAAPCRCATSLLCGFNMKIVALVQFSVHWKQMVLCSLYLFGNVLGFIPVNSVVLY
ncbi:Os03g0629800, partial [Oryza sativa Japonica Group]